MHSYVFLRAFSGTVFPCFLSFFLVSFGDFAGGIFCAFPGAFFTVFWCFFPCIFSCLSLFFSIYVSPWWWSCFSPCFFSCFLGVFSVLFFVLFVVFFFVSFIVRFFVHFFVLFLAFLSCFFFRALGGTQDKQPQYFAFWPVLFSVLFLVVTTSEDRIYTIYTLPESNIAPENRVSQKETIVFQPSIFRCKLAVSFREGNPLNNKI